MLNTESNSPSKPTPGPHATRAEANRNNAQKSTGPKSDAGKARSARNAVKHGLTGGLHPLPHEDPNIIQGLQAHWNDWYEPEDPSEVVMVELMALGQLNLQRVQALQTAKSKESRVQAQVDSLMRLTPAVRDAGLPVDVLWGRLRYQSRVASDALRSTAAGRAKMRQFWKAFDSEVRTDLLGRANPEKVEPSQWLAEASPAKGEWTLHYGLDMHEKRVQPFLDPEVYQCQDFIALLDLHNELYDNQLRAALDKRTGINASIDIARQSLRHAARIELEYLDNIEQNNWKDKTSTDVVNHYLGTTTLEHLSILPQSTQDANLLLRYSAQAMSQFTKGLNELRKSRAAKKQPMYRAGRKFQAFSWHVDPVPETPDPFAHVGNVLHPGMTRSEFYRLPDDVRLKMYKHALPLLQEIQRASAAGEKSQVECSNPGVSTAKATGIELPRDLPSGFRTLIERSWETSVQAAEAAYPNEAKPAEDVAQQEVTSTSDRTEALDKELHGSAVTRPERSAAPSDLPSTQNVTSEAVKLAPEPPKVE